MYAFAVKQRDPTGVVPKTIGDPTRMHWIAIRNESEKVQLIRQVNF